VIYGAVVALAAPLALRLVTRLLTRSVAVFDGLDVLVAVPVCDWETLPVLLVCDGVCVWVLVFVAELLLVAVGLEVALPVFDTAPPVALVAPAVCVKLNVELLPETPPATAAVLVFLPESPLPPAETLPALSRKSCPFQNQ
jgi:hypothetical protein